MSGVSVRFIAMALPRLLTQEAEVRHFLGSDDVLNAGLVVLGLLAILLSRKFPQVLAAVASIGFGLWTALVLQSWQEGEKIPEGIWIPIVGLVVVGAIAAAVVKYAWKVGLALLTASLVTLLVLAGCHFVNITPQQLAGAGADLFSNFSIVGVAVMVGAVIASVVVVKRFHEAMYTFASVHLGTLMLLSGLSYFIQRFGADEAPLSLLDSLTHLVSDIGSCEATSQGCDCGAGCQVEIALWIFSSWAIIIGRALYLRRREKKAAERKEMPESKEAAKSIEV